MIQINVTIGFMIDDERGKKSINFKVCF